MLASKIFFPENASWLDGSLAISNHGSPYWLSSRLIFPYDFKTNGMLLTGKSFCFFEINTWPLPRKNFTILSQKIKGLEESKVTWVDCKY